LRNPIIGLEEYAPGNIIYVDGKKLRVIGVNFRRTGSVDDTGGAIENFYQKCPTCDYVSFSESDLYCKYCGEEMQRDIYLDAISFRAEDSGPITSAEEARVRRGYDVERYLMEGPPEKLVFEYPELKMSYQRSSKVFFVNNGFADRETPVGFEICTACGLWRDPSHANWDKYHQNTRKCEGKVKQYRLGFTMNTDVLIIDIKPPEERTKDFLITLRNALVEGANILLETESDEISGFERIITTEEGTNHQIILYDAVPGGSGYLPRIARQLPQVAKVAYDLLSKCTCVNSCYACLRSYYNQREHQHLDKTLILEHLNKLSNAIPLEGEVKIEEIAQKSQQKKTESPIEDELLQAIKTFKLPKPDVQYNVMDENGELISRADFAYPHKKLLIYCDGEEFHATAKQWQKDIEQQNRLQSMGWRVLRFTGKKIKQNTEECINEIRKFLKYDFS
jgi:very-short-patch-repair endonuclease